MKEQIVYKKISELTLNPQNPRKNDNAVDKVALSIEKYGFRNPLVVDENGVVYCGNTRLKAAAKLKLKEVPCLVVKDLTEQQIREYALLDNKTNEIADWDYEMLKDELADLDLDDFELDWGFSDIDAPSVSYNKLADDFLFSPFSVLDGRKGDWMQRKRQWKALGIKSELGRDAECLQTNIGEKYGRKEMSGTSIFDPVLCELMYKWFNVEKGSIYDCFAGGSVRGIVADKLGYDYTGIELRKEQVDANIKNAKEIGVNPKWICDDSLNVDKYLEDETQDMIFSCPPYLDLEVYSNDERDLSNMEYDKFAEVYSQIIQKAVNKLKPDRFAVFVVGDVRDKNGFYRDFISLTKKCFINAGCLLYNDIIKIDPIGTAGIRARKTFESRKVVKVHQNILVFYKGNPKNIKLNYKDIKFADDGEFEVEEEL